MERLRYDDDKAFLLADDAATIARIVRTVPAEKLRGTKLDQWTALEVIGHVTDAAGRPGVHSDWGQVDAGHFAAYQADHSHGHASDLAALFPPTA